MLAQQLVVLGDLFAEELLLVFARHSNTLEVTSYINHEFDS
jgi:hypothetical protein